MSQASTDDDASREGPPSSEGLGPLPEHRAVVAYLYHDAASAQEANPLLHSTLLVLAHDRQKGMIGETPLVTLAQADAMVAAERERWLELAAEMRGMVERGEMPDGDHCSVGVAMWAEDWLRKLRA